MIMDFLNKHYKGIVLLMLFLLMSFSTVVKVIEIASPKTAGISEAIVNELLGPMMDKKLAPVITTVDRIEKNLPTVQDNSMVLLLEFHLNTWTTADQVNKAVNMWEEQKWGSQISALKYIARDVEAQRYLQETTVYPEVYRAFRMKAARY